MRSFALAFLSVIPLRGICFCSAFALAFLSVIPLRGICFSTPPHRHPERAQRVEGPASAFPLSSLRHRNLLSRLRQIKRVPQLRQGPLSAILFRLAPRLFEICSACRSLDSTP